MMRIGEEQKAILNCYEGGRTKVIREIRAGIEELVATGEDPEILELMTALLGQLEHCTNKEFFRVKKDCQIDTEEEEAGAEEL